MGLLLLLQMTFTDYRHMLPRFLPWKQMIFAAFSADCRAGWGRGGS